MTKWYCTLFFVFIASFIHAQEISIDGKIIDSYGEPVPFANIIIKTDSLKVETIGYGYADGNGMFSIVISTDKKNILINITAIGYQEQTVDLNIENSLTVNVIMEQDVTDLKEVVLVTRKIKDTIDIDIENMNLTKDDNLQEILEKTSGVILGDDGNISYQGKQINKVMVNGKEVFINQNKIALENLNFEIMENVQIIDNYKDKFSLGFERMRNPILNIDTKSEFKGIFKAKANIGYGYKEKYSIDGKGFFFSDKFNMFLTSNTNNFGEKELSQNDITAPFRKYTSPILEGILSSFFETDLRVKKNFVSNNSLTVRREGENSKSGAVLYYGNVRTDVERTLSTFIGDTLARNTVFNGLKEGGFFSSSLNHTHKFNSKTVLQNILGVFVMSKEDKESSLDSIFTVEPMVFLETTNRKPTNFSLVNSMSITTLLGDRNAFDLGLNFYQENVSEDLDTQLINSDASAVLQRLDYSNTQFSFMPDFQFKLNRSTLTVGASLSSVNEKTSVDFFNNSFPNEVIERNVLISEVPITYQGSKGRFDYNLSFSPTLINVDESKGQGILQTSNTFVYNFKSQDKLSFGISRSYNLQDITKFFSTLSTNFNNITKGQVEKKDGFTTKDRVSLSWFKSNVAKSQSHYLVYDYMEENDYIQTNLDSISNNLFIYSNRELDNKRSHNINLGTSKGFYFGRKFNKIGVNANLKFSHISYPIIIEDVKRNTSITSWEPSLILTYFPRNFFIREIKNTLKWNPRKFRLDGNEINQQTTFNNSLIFEGGRDKLSWSFNFDYLLYDVEQRNFDVPDVNIFAQYELSNKITLAIEGNYLLTLFDINNFNSIETISNGNIITQILNDNNLGVLLLKASIGL